MWPPRGQKVSPQLCVAEWLAKFKFKALMLYAKAKLVKPRPRTLSKILTLRPRLRPMINITAV